MQEPMNILTTASDDYFNPLAVMLTSLFCNNKNRAINVYILNSGYTMKQKEILFQLAINKKHKIILKKVEKDKFEGIRWDNVTETAYKLLILEQLSKSMSRVLFIDADVIINKNLDIFYDTDFKNNVIMASGHNISESKLKSQLKSGVLHPEYGECFNSGIILYNLEKLKHMYKFNDVINIARTINYKLGEQGIQNYLFWDKTLYVDSKIYNNRGYKGIPIEEVVFFHYATNPRPWEISFTSEDIEFMSGLEVLKSEKYIFFTSFYADMIDIWWYYAKQSPVYETVLAKKEITQKFFEEKVVKDLLVSINKDMKRLQLLASVTEIINRYGSISECLKSKGIKKCAIYGMGKAGQFVLNDLKRDHFTISYFSDQKNYPNLSIPYKTVDELKDEECPLIICVAYEQSSLKRKLTKKTRGKVILLSELL